MFIAQVLNVICCFLPLKDRKNNAAPPYLFMKSLFIQSSIITGGGNSASSDLTAQLTNNGGQGKIAN